MLNDGEQYDGAVYPGNEEEIIVIADEELDKEALRQDDSDTDNEENESPTYASSSGHLWHEWNEVTGSGRRSEQNIVGFIERRAAGVNRNNEKESFLLFFEPTLEMTLRFTNLQGKRATILWNRGNPSDLKSFKQIDLIELQSFVGLLIILGM